METAIHSSNDIPSVNSPSIIASANHIPHEEVPAAVVDREVRISDMTDEEYRTYMNDQMRQGRPVISRGLDGSRSSLRSGSVGDRVVPGEWRHRVIEPQTAEEAKFGKLRDSFVGESVHTMKDAEKRQYAASKVHINEAKLSKAVPISARSYDDLKGLPPSPPIISEDTPDAWYEEHRRQGKERRLSKELNRQATLSREGTESNGSFGHTVKKAFSDAGASIGRTTNSAVKGSENKARDHQEMAAHQRLAKYFPQLEKERFICAFDAEVVHADRPVAGHIILTSGSVCFIGKGHVKVQAVGTEHMDDDQMLDSILKSPDVYGNSVASRGSTTLTHDGSISGKSDKSSRKFSFFSSSSKKDGIKKEPLLIAQCIPLIDVLSYAPGIVVKCNDARKTFIADIPTDEMIPNALQLFAKDGHVYQFRHFHSRYMTEESKGMLTDGHDASYYDRFVNFLDHAWRSQGCGH